MGGDQGAERFSPGAGGSPAAGRGLTGARLALLGLLVVLVALGLHTHVRAPVWDRHSRAYDAALAGGLEAVVTILLITLWWRRRRAPAYGLAVERLRRALSYVLVTGLVVLAVVLGVLLIDIHLAHLGAAPPVAPPARPPLGRSFLPAHGSGSGSNLPLSQILYGLVAALLVVAIAAVALRLVRYGRSRPSVDAELPAQEYGQVLQDAVRSGQRALMQLDDARAAIIACYVAMEASLARAGTARSKAETPDELLARAAAVLSNSSGAAAHLTALFYEARFSTHPLHEGQKQAAERALAELASELAQADAMPAGAAL